MKNIKHTTFSHKEVEIGPESSYNNYIMAIESSCDETACAIVKNGREVIANVVASQIKTHAKFGGVIPEIAAREHLDSINIVIDEAFAQAKENCRLEPKDITAFAGTVGPGLVGCLLVGLNAAKTLSLVFDKPFIGVNHTIIVVVVAAVVASVILAKRAAWYWLGLTIILAYMLNRSSLLSELYDIVENNAVSTISILDTDDGKARAMVINGGNSSKISEDKDLWFGYMRYVQDNFIETLPKDTKKDILILGAGGFTMGEGDTFHNYTFLDIDKSLLQISEEKFLEHKLDANKKFVVEDANQFLKDSEQKYDLIVLDTYSSMGIIPMDLITKEYFIRVKNNLKKGGIVVMNILTSPNFSNAFAINLDNTIRSVFTHSLSRQVIGNFNAWGHQRANVIYVYYDVADKGGIYTADKNAVFYDM